MKKKLFSLLLASALVAGLVTGCGGGDNPATTTTKGASEGTGTESKAGETSKTASGETFKIVLITMDSTDQHWVSVDKGAQKAATEAGNVEYQWMAPDKKDDAQQIERINNAIASGANAILIAANGPDSITSALKEAEAEGIKIIYVDSPANFPAEATFATDNKAAGQTAGEEMIQALKDKGVTSGSIGIVNINASTKSTVLREEGFRAAFEGSDFKILETQYAEGDTAKSQDAADNFITDGCVGIFGANEGATVGVGNAIKGDGGEVVGVGFDKSDSILSLIKDGTLYCTMVQNPDVMGYEGLMAAVKVLQGEKLEKTEVDTGVAVINKDNVDTLK